LLFLYDCCPVVTLPGNRPTIVKIITFVVNFASGCRMSIRISDAHRVIANKRI
jgi:hypothetical protein